MKKLFIAIVSLFIMSTSMMAQTNEKDNTLTFERMSSYLELTSSQMEPVKTAMAQFSNSMEAYYQLKDASKGSETWEKIQARHKMTMKKILSGKQYDKYVEMLNLTAKNTAERIIEQQTASK